MSPDYFAENQTLQAEPEPRRYSSIKKPTYEEAVAAAKKLREGNPERQARKASEYDKKLRAYKRSETYKRVVKRAGGRCEKLFPVNGIITRCAETKGLHHHHLTYGAAGDRFGGKELPEDIRVLCPPHHAEEEAFLRPQNRSRRGGKR